MIEIESSSSKSKPNEEDSKVTVADDPRVLENTYYYQNLKTGSISTSPLTVRQLCKILCPPSATQAVVRSLTPDSSIIGFDTSTNQYSSDGWQILKNVPVLKECCALWYYYGVENDEENRNNNKGTNDTQQQQQVVKGPVTCRFLAKLLSHETIQPETKVYCHTTEPQQQQQQQQQQQKSPEWKPIHEIPSLRIAMLAFDTTPPPWQLNTTTTNATSADESKGCNGSPATQQQQEYDASMMTFDTTTNDDTSKNNNCAAAADVQDELEAFLTSTAGIGPKDHNSKPGGDEEEEEEGYESDGGTTYVKDPLSGNYIHSALVPPSAKPKKPTTSKSTSTNSTTTANNNNNNPTKKRKKKQKAKFSAKSAKCWVYVTGLPLDCTLEEVIDTFSKVGILDLDPETQKPKVKLYKHHKGPLQGTLKGDASICYARPESVDLALQLLDEAQFIRSTTVTRKSSYSTSDPLPIIRVQRAKFEQHGDIFESTKKRNISQAKRKVVRMAALQAVDWDEGDNGRISGGRKGLRIIVLKHMFHPRDLKEDTEDAALRKLEQDVHTECEQWGTVEKITIFAKNPQGVMIVKFAQPSAASTAVKEYNGRSPPVMNHINAGKNGGGGGNKSIHDNTLKIDANYWDGVTDYTIHDEEKEIHETKKRHDEFGKWLDNQDDLPEEFKLQVEGH